MAKREGNFGLHGMEVVFASMMNNDCIFNYNYNNNISSNHG